MVIQFHETSENTDYITSIKELQDIVSAIRVTSCLLLPLIMNEDEDNILATNSSGKRIVGVDFSIEKSTSRL